MTPMDGARRMGPEGLTTALAALGELLLYRGLAYEVVVVGGANLLLRGAISRPTKDADLIGERLDNGQIVKLSQLPSGLARAVSDVAATYGLDRNNTAVLLKAAAWCKSQDPSPAFEKVMGDVLSHLDVDASDG